MSLNKINVYRFSIEFLPEFYCFSISFLPKQDYPDCFNKLVSFFGFSHIVYLYCKLRIMGYIRREYLVCSSFLWGLCNFNAEVSPAIFFQKSTIRKILFQLMEITAKPRNLKNQFQMYRLKLDKNTRTSTKHWWECYILCCQDNIKMSTLKPWWIYTSRKTALIFESRWRWNLLFYFYFYLIVYLLWEIAICGGTLLSINRLNNKKEQNKILQQAMEVSFLNLLGQTM